MNSICWNITKKCNMNCQYCFREINESDLTIQENIQKLDELTRLGVRKITWSGGEPTEYDGIEKLLQLSKQHGVYNKIVTNASNLNDEQSYKIFEYLDEVVFSVDFVDDDLNAEFGRGNNYFKHICDVIRNIQCYYSNCFIGINTVVMKPNLLCIDKIYNEIKKLKINKWKLIQFSPFRGKALVNSEYFFITDAEFNCIKQKYEFCNNLFQIQSHTIVEMQLKHLIVSPAGMIFNA